MDVHVDFIIIIYTCYFIIRLNYTPFIDICSYLHVAIATVANKWEIFIQWKQIMTMKISAIYF